MWFWLSLIALLCWSGSDLFSKIGCQSETDKYSHLKMVTAVGVVMGLHAAYEIFIGGVSVSWNVIWTYLPVSLLYIVSMALGYIGLRYIELSISSPICNASGAVVAVLYLCFGGLDEDLTGGMRVMALAAVASLSLGVLKGWNIFGLTIFDSLDYLTANILLPAGGFFTCIFVGWRLDRKILKAEISNNGTLKFRIYGVFIFLVRYVCPAVLLLIFLDNLGLF